MRPSHAQRIIQRTVSAVSESATVVLVSRKVKELSNAIGGWWAKFYGGWWPPTAAATAANSPGENTIATPKGETSEK